MMLILRLSIIPMAIGVVTLILLLRGSTIKHKTLLILSIAMPLGLGICSLLLYFSYLIDGAHPQLSSLVLSYVLVAALVLLWFSTTQNLNVPGPKWNAFQLWLSQKHVLRLPDIRKCPKKRLISYALAAILFLGFIAALFYFVYFFTSFSIWNIFGGWDARYHWNLKARFLHRTPEYWQLIFSHHVVPDVENYPLFLPAAIAWGWNLAGREVLIWPSLIAFFFSLSLGLFILWYASSFIHPAAGLTCASFFFMNPVYQFWSTSQYADVPLCFLVTSASACLLISFRHNDIRFSLLSGLLAGMSFWLKNEGALFLIACFFVILISLLWDKSLSREFKKRQVLAFFAGTVVPVFAVLYLKFFLAPADIYSRHGQGLSRLFSGFSDIQKTLFISAAFYSFKIRGFKFEGSDYSWNYLWHFFACAVVYAVVLRRKVFTQYKLWIFLLILVIMETGYFVIFHITPIKLTFHLQTALHRLLLHNGILALIFAFETVGWPWPSHRSEIQPATSHLKHSHGR